MDRFQSEPYALYNMPEGEIEYKTAAINECQNCGRSVETLHHVPEWDFMGCDDCMDEAMAELAREQAGLAARKSAAKVCCNCKTNAARWDSIYCSDSCRRAFLTFPEVA